MPNLATLATDAIVSLLTAPAGIDFALNAIAHTFVNGPSLSISSVLKGNTPADLFEKSTSLRYPTVNVYCDKISNTLEEKFRIFSGTLSVIVEIRFSQDQVQNVQENLQGYVTATCQVLDESRGDLGNGIFYPGGYEISFGPVKKGGTNFIQIARVSLVLDASV